MFKKIFSVLVFLVLNISAHAQITRAQLAERVFNVLYTSTYDNPDLYDAVNFPNPFLDLQDNSEISKKIRILSYLEYDDGITCFHTEFPYFYPNSYIARAEALSVIMEAWAVPPYYDYQGASPYSDVSTLDAYFEYIKGAYNLNIISGTTFRPWDLITNDEVTDIISAVIDHPNNYHPVPHSDLLDLNNYFIPNNYSPYNLNTLKGIEQGVFSHYAKNSFVIPDIKLDLNFSHFYSTTRVELPEGFFPIKPLSRGWSHTYNSYVLKGNVNGEIIYTIVWADGTINIWNEDNQEYISKGVYDDFDEYSSTRLYITKKNRTRYKFRKLDSDRDIYYLTQIKDKNNNNIYIDYESAIENDTKRIRYVESPSGKRLNFEYRNDTDLIEIITDPLNRNIEFEYSGVTPGWVYQYPVLVGFSDAKNQTTDYSYGINDSHNVHLLNRIELPRGNLITAQYNNDAKLTEYAINNTSVNVNVDYSNIDALESDILIPMPNGSTQNFHYEYNENGVITQFQNDTDNISFTYNAPENINTNRPNNINKNGLDIDYEYDNNGNVTRITTENDLVERFWYNSNNDINRYRDANGNETNFYYEDNDENLTRIKDALNNNSTFTYDNHGQMLTNTNQEGITINYTYENDGAIETITAPENMSASFNYDGINRMLSKTINGQTSSYTYDLNDNLETHTNIGGLTTTFNYDENDNVASITNANGVATTFSYNNEDQVESETFGSLVKQYEYNDDGTLDKFTKPSGDNVNYSYDSDGRLKETGTITDISYYSNGNEKGLIKTIENINGHYKYYYDNYNRVDKVRDYFNNTDTIEYDYDDVGNIIKITYPNNPVNFKVIYIYDAKNRMTHVKTSVNGNEQDIIEYIYRNDDKLINIRYKNNSNQNIIKYLIYDNIGRLTQIYYRNTPVGGGTATLLYKEELNINNRGNILSDDKYYAAAETNYELTQETETYNYDQNNQITQAGITNYNVDDDGNAIQKGSLNLNYDIDDRLTSITGNNGATTVNIQHKYDVYGNRIEKDIIAGTTNPETRKYVWDVMNNNIIKEYNSNGSEKMFYVYGVSGLEFAINPSTGTIDKFYHGDVRSSVVFTTNTNADVINNHFNKYDDFGNIITPHATDTEEYGAFYYLGKHGIISDVTAYDGLYQVKARYYDAKLGRFLTQDPIWSTNLYPYANNNPISRFDPSGEKSYLVSVLNPQKDPGYDALFIGVSGVSTEGIGGNVGANLNFLISGENASLIPVLTGTGGPTFGQDTGFSINIGLCRDWVSGNFTKYDLESNGSNNHTINIAYLGLGISMQYDTVSDGRRIECNVVTIGSLFSASFSQNKTSIISRKQIWNYFK